MSGVADPGLHVRDSGNLHNYQMSGERRYHHQYHRASRASMLTLTIALQLFLVTNLVTQPVLGELQVKISQDSAPSTETKVADPSPSPPSSPVDQKRQQRRSESGKRSVKEFYYMFQSKEALDRVISRWSTDEAFYENFKPLFTNAPIAKLVNALNEVARRGVKERFAKVVDKQDGTIAYDIEASDWDSDLRRERHENSSQQGKTGIFIAIFRRILDWFFGREYLEKALKEGRDRYRVLDRLREMGISHEVNETELDNLQKEFAKKTLPYKGSEFDPFTCQQWPDLGKLSLWEEDLR